MNYYLLIPFFLIIIFFIPIKLYGKFSFNLLELSGAFGIFLFGIKVDSELFWIENKKLISKKEDEVESHEFNMDSKEVLFVKTFLMEIKDKTRLKELFVFYNLGVGDAFRSAMLGGLINVTLLSVMTSIKNIKPTASLGVYDTISYNREVCQFALKTRMSISLFDVVYSLVRSVILTRKNAPKMDGDKEEK